MRSLTIPIKGPCETSEDGPREVAIRLLGTDQLDVVSTGRILGREPLYVLHIDDWGRTKGLPVNYRAWALCGGSPIHGLAVLSADDGDDLPAELVAAISAPTFPGAAVRADMERFLAEGG